MNIRDRIKELRRVPGRELRANPLNFRKHPTQQRSALAGILEAVGMASALVAFETDDGLELIDGHLRAEDYGDTEWPVLILDVDRAEANLLLATLDPLAALAEQDNGALRKLVGSMDPSAAILAKAALDADSLRKLFEPLQGQCDPDDVPEAPSEPVTRPGDIWQLGSHRLICGDSREPATVASLMGDVRCELLFTSPPYDQQRNYDGAADVSDWQGMMRGVFGAAAGALASNAQVLVNLGLIHRDGEWQPYWDGWIEWMRVEGWKRFGWYVWDQGFGLPGDWNGRLAPSHEFVFHFCKTPAKPVKWVEKNAANIKPRNAGESTMRGKDGKPKKFTNPGASAQATKVPDSVVRVNRQVGSDGHPAQFSVGFAEAIIRTYRGRVFEPFAGSGTTLIAAEQLGRRCYAIEISPAYCDIIVARWEKFTGKKAVRTSGAA